MHSSDSTLSGISVTRAVLGLSLNGRRLQPEWIIFRRHCQKVHPSHWMTSLDHLANLRGEEDEEGNALPRRLATFCATLSIIMHEVPSCRPTQNGLDRELTLEVMSPGMIVPSHLGTILMISASRI